MKITLGNVRRAIAAVALAGAAIAGSQAARAQTPDETAAAVQAKLHAKQYSNVRVSVDANGIATLSGKVELFEYKADADRMTHKVKGVTAVRNDIEVGGATVSDAEIAKKLAPQLAFSREGYGNVFDAIQLKIEDGVVTLGGHVHDYPSRDAALGIAATMPGVKDVVDEIAVDPLSPMDNRIRMDVARAIYSAPALDRYAIDPLRPIRISVQNGNVELYGTVDREADKDVAYMQAKSVPGTFSVKNFIEVAGQPSEKQKK